MASKDLDFWDELGDAPKMTKSPARPTKEQLKKADVLIQAMKKFDTEMSGICSRANKAINFPNEFVHIDPGKYCISGDDKSITIWKYFAGYECYAFCTKYPTSYSSGKRTGDTPEADEAWKKLDAAFETFEDEMYSLAEEVVNSNPILKKYNNPKWVICNGKDNTDMPPAVEDFRLYWSIELTMKLE